MNTIVMFGLFYLILLIWGVYAVDWLLTTGVELFPDELSWLVIDTTPDENGE